ncbi:hypothetical protein OUZ56_028306 [Daphnia magna]|uniref:Uncharacterized protein n=1 Tax=Daphnia magna TaxID=35525 RepID=A0ABR0B3G3_9CRUS|nr:hypothetical protein OUZ56_028306 [Daphnia magna]
MCECSKRHLQRNGGQLTGNNIVLGASAEHVNGYIKHVMRHHKGRGGGHCPLINRTATTPVRHQASNKIGTTTTSKKRDVTRGRAFKEFSI